MSEASDHFRQVRKSFCRSNHLNLLHQLGRKLEDAEEPQYAAFCHLATSRCVLHIFGWKEVSDSEEQV